MQFKLCKILANIDLFIILLYFKFLHLKSNFYNYNYLFQLLLDRNLKINYCYHYQ